MERLVRLAAVLHGAGRHGVPATTLIEVAGFEGGADPASQLGRELRHMRDLGWQIDRVSADGEPAVYRMTSVDNRLSVRLTPGQQAALRRAVLLADRADLADRLALPETTVEVPAAVPAGTPDDRLAVVIRAVRMRCLLRFGYAGSRRVVHPDSVRAQNGTWYLLALEEGSGRAKVFVVSRMSEVEADQPGSARAFPRERHPGLHPMSWKVDPPVEVTLSAPTAFVPDVERWLGTPVSYAKVGGPDDEVELVYVVTNRSALRARVYQLGTRVRVLGPEEVRAEILAELAEMAGE
jgi:predicted DNA-binding transcriptional regulator YafY